MPARIAYGTPVGLSIGSLKLSSRRFLEELKKTNVRGILDKTDRGIINEILGKTR